MHYVGHLSVNELNAIKPLPVRKLNMKCLHILQKLKTLMNFKYSCSKAIIFRMLINHIVWELDSLCFLLRNIVHISAWQSWAIYFPLYFIFVHAAQFPCLNPSCMDRRQILFCPLVCYTSFYWFFFLSGLNLFWPSIS